MVLGLANYIGLKHDKPSSSSGEEQQQMMIRNGGGLAEAEEETLRRKNMELERELKKSMEREEKMRQELQRTTQRLLLLQDAEEMLCSQMGELEAEALQQARFYHAQIMSLTDQLSHAQNLLHSSNIVTPTTL